MVRDYQVIIKRIHSFEEKNRIISYYRVFWSMIYQKIGSIYDNAESSSLKRNTGIGVFFLTKEITHGQN